jgi:hypothetical protein
LTILTYGCANYDPEFEETWTWDEKEGYPQTGERCSRKTRGRITFIDKENETISVREESGIGIGKTLDLTISEKTTITNFQGQPILFQQLKHGDSVIVSYDLIMMKAMDIKDLSQ